MPVTSEMNQYLIQKKILYLLMTILQNIVVLLKILHFFVM